MDFVAAFRRFDGKIKQQGNDAGSEQSRRCAAGVAADARNGEAMSATILQKVHLEAFAEWLAEKGFEVRQETPEKISIMVKAASELPR